MTPERRLEIVRMLEQMSAAVQGFVQAAHACGHPRFAALGQVLGEYARLCSGAYESGVDPRALGESGCEGVLVGMTHTHAVAVGEALGVAFGPTFDQRPDVARALWLAMATGRSLGLVPAAIVDLATRQAPPTPAPAPPPPPATELAAAAAYVLRVYFLPGELCGEPGVADSRWWPGNPERVAQVASFPPNLDLERWATRPVGDLRAHLERLARRPARPGRQPRPRKPAKKRVETLSLNGSKPSTLGHPCDHPSLQTHNDSNQLDTTGGLEGMITHSRGP